MTISYVTKRITKEYGITLTPMCKDGKKIAFITIEFYATSQRYISGNVITDNVCDIIAIDAPVFVSPPYAAGYTMVLSPKGVAKAISARVIISLFIPKAFITITNTAGITISLKNVAI